MLKNDYIDRDGEQANATNQASAGETRLDGVKIKENYQRALELYYESAEQGDTYSQLQLGKMFWHGLGVERDYKAALEWYQKSAAQGNGEAQAYLGLMYEKGLEVDRDIQKALALYKKSAEQGNALGQARLAGCYLSGSGVEQNPRVAFVWYEKSAAQGNDEAQAHLGHMYEKGLGVNRDIRRAAELYRKSAGQENALGQLRLGDFHLNGIGVERNPRKAFAWYRKAAAQEQDPECAAQAQFRLGAMYCQGNGIEKDLPKGFEFYEKAARGGNAEAQFCLGAMYEDGVGVARDHKKALEWFQKSAKKSKTPANSAMGDIYRDGLVVERNIAEAIQWYKKAAEEGDAYAKTELLKLQLEESAPPKAKTEPVPAGKGETPAMAGAADARPAGTGGENRGQKIGPRPDPAVGDTNLPLRGKLQPMPRPKSAKLRIAEKIPEKKSPLSVPRQSRQARGAPTPAMARYLFSALGLILVSLAIVFFGFRKKPAATWESVKLRVTEVSPLPRPDPQWIPAMVMEPPGVILKRIKADISSRQKGEKIPAPVMETARAVVAIEPVAPVLRREYRSLDEGEIANMLTVKNIFDVNRNPGGDFRHRYEIKDSAGLRLIVDRATNLAWTRQQNPVRMNLKKSLEWIASLNNAGYGGSRNWRLPTVEEAAALLKKKTNAEKTFLDAIFGDGLGAIWTGDSFTESESWIVDFQNGTIDPAKNKSRLATLMVRSEPD